MKRLMAAMLLCCMLMLTACGAEAPVLENSVDTTEASLPEITTQTVPDIPETEETIPTTHPEPYYFDEYGVRFVLVEGSTDEYVIDESYWESMETPDSSALTEISYWPYGQQLRVQFRNSGAWYTYHDVPLEIWQAFKNADSKGSYYNQCIKGSYECTKD